jgi:hypothetical protein
VSCRFRLWAYCAFIVISPLVSPYPTMADVSDPPKVTGLGSNFFVTNEAGWVGIGTNNPRSAVDLQAGEIKLGSSGAPCRPPIAGALGYADGRLKLCDGNRWRTISLDKPQ